MADRSIIVRLMAEVGGFVSGMGKAGRSAREFEGDVTRTGKSQESAFQKMTRSARENGAAWTSAGMKMTAAGAGIGLALAGTVREAMRWETAFTGVRKTVDGTPEQLAAVEQGLRQLARELPATHTQIAAVAEAAGQLGVSTDGISEFTRTMVMLGESTNMTAETAAMQLARFGSIMGTTEQDIGRVASSLVGLGNNFAATESEIAGMSLRLAAAGRQAGLTEAEVMGLAAAALQVGVNVEAGGTALSTTIMRIGQAVDQGGTQLELFGHVADMTGEQFARAWRDDATSALTTFIQGLETAEERGMTMNGALADLGITAIREGGTLRSLAFASEDLAAAVATSSAAFTEGNALVDEFGNFLGTTASQVALAQNSLRDAAIDIGAVFLPVVVEVAQGVAAVAQWFASLPAPVRNAGVVLTAVTGVLLTVGGAFLMLVPKVLATVDALKTLGVASKVSGALGGLRGKIGGLAGSFGGLKAMLGKVGIALAALAAGDALVRWGSESAQGVEETTAALLDGREAVDELFTALSRNVNFRSIDGLTGAIERLVNPTMIDRLNDFGGEFVSLITFNSREGSVERDAIVNQFNAMGDSLAQLVMSGHAEIAADQFSMLANEWQAAGGNLEDLKGLLPSYAQALTAASNQQELAERSAAGAAEATEELAAAQAEATAAAAEAEASFAQAQEALEQWRGSMLGAAEQFGGAMSAFQSAGEAAARGTRDAFRPPSMSAWISHLEEQGRLLLEWRDLSIRAGEQVREELPADMHAAGMAMVNELREAGPEGAAALRILTEASAEERARLIEAWSGTGAMIGEQVVADIEASDAPTIVIEADDGPATVTLDEFLASMASADGEITFTGNVQQPRRLLHDVTAEINDATGEVTILASDGTAVTVLRNYVMSVDEASGAVTISGDDAYGRQVVATFTHWTETREPVIAVTADTSEATRAITSWVQQHGNIRVPVTLYQRGNLTPHVATSALPGRASGGRLPGVPPSNPSADNLLGVDPSGMPMVRVRSREWVVNEQASDFYGDRLMSLINQRAIPREALASMAALPGYAAGGRLAGRSLADLEALRRDWMSDLDVTRAWIRVEQLQAQLAASGRDALTGLHRVQAQLELDETMERLQRADRARHLHDHGGWAEPGSRRYTAAEFDAAISAARERERAEQEAAREAQARQEQARREAQARQERAGTLSLAVSRGQIIGQATSGLSGAQSVADQLRSMASDDRLGLSAQQRQALNAAANTAEGTFTRLFEQADGVAERLGEARDRVQELSQIRAGAQSAIMQGFRLADALQESTTRTQTVSGAGWFEETEGPSGAGALAQAQAFAGRVQKFAGLLQRLQRAGFTGVILQQIAGMGVEAGIPAAEALLELGASDVRAMNQAFADIEKWAGQAGQFVTEGFFQGGLSAAEGIVAGLLAEQDQINAAIEQVARGMQNALKRALGISSPSRVFRDLLREVPRGAALGILDGVHEVDAAAARMLAVPTSMASQVVTVNVAAPAPVAPQAPTGRGEPPRLHRDDMDYIADRLARAVKNGARGGPGVITI